MISTLITALLPITLLLSLILLIRKPLSKFTDANTTYAVWILIPLGLACYFLPAPWQQITELNNANIAKFIVNPTQQLNQNLSVNGLLWLWSLGTISLCIYWLINHFHYKNKIKLQCVQQPTEYPDFPKNLVLSQSSHIHSPVLMGLFKQTLVIPEDFDNLYNKEQQQLIIAHEVCHFSQHHMWMNQIALLLLALFWFHPLAWRAYACFRQDQEHSCDQTVLARRQVKSRIQYCKALVLAAETSPPNAFTLMSFKQNGEQNFMYNRIKQIKNMSKIKSRNMAIIALVSTSLLAGVSYAGNQVNHTTADHKTQNHDLSPIYRVSPKYPLQAAKDKVEGSVVLKFDINAKGLIENVEVVNAKPAYVFDKTAVTALKQWRYHASGKYLKNQLVQLDYVMDQNSVTPESLIERIKVKGK